MKKTLLLAAALAGAATAMAQLSAQSKTQITYDAHALTTGDAHRTQAVAFCEPLSEGANQVWDYSGAALLGGDVFTETLAAGADGNNITAGNPLGTQFAFNVTPQSNEFWGYKHGNYALELEQPIVKTRFPQSYLDEFSGEFAGTYKYNCACGKDGAGARLAADGKYYSAVKSAAVSGTYSTAVDGYGTIILPGGKVFSDVLRVKTIEAYSDGYVQEKYLWYSALLRYPIFVTHVNLLSRDGKQNREQRTSHVSRAALDYAVPAERVVSTASAERFAYDVFPNPVESQTQVSYALAAPAKVSLKAYDVYGQLQQVLVSEQVQKEGAHQYNYAPAMVGTYFVVLEVGGERISKVVVKK